MDFSYLISISEGDEAFIDEFIATFESNTGQLTNQMRTAYESGNHDQLKKLAHQLKPSLEMLALESLDQAVSIQNNPESTTKEQIEAIDTDCQKALDGMRMEFGRA